MLKLSGLVFWRLGSRAVVRKYSGPSATVFKTEKLELSTNIPDKRLQEITAEEKENGKIIIVNKLILPF